MPQLTMLERQTALLRYLTDPFAYGAEKGEGLLGSDQGIEKAPLAFVGRGGLGARVGKVRGKLRVTSRALGDDFFPLMKKFGHLYPPSEVGGVEAAEQFQRFLEKDCLQELSKIPFLADVCCLELAMARVARPEEELPYIGAVFTLGDQPGRRYRISGGCEAVECAYDIRPLFDTSVDQAVLPRDVLLGLFYADGKLRVLEIAPGIFSLINLIRTFTVGAVGLVPEGYVAEVAVWLERLKIIEAV